MKKILVKFCCFAIALCSAVALFACNDPEPTPPPPPTISVWNGEIPGWNNPNLPDSDIIANRPSSYVVNETNKTVDINDATAFAWFAYRSVLGEQGFKGYTVKLNIDIDLDNNMWIPISLGGRSNAPRVAFQGTFDGQNHKIINISNNKFTESIRYGKISQDPEAENTYYIEYKNKANNELVANIPLDVKVNDDGFDEYCFGLFGTTKDATIKNLTVEGVNFDVSPVQVDGATNKVIGDSVGAIVGFARGNTTLENCTAGKVRVGESFGKIKGATSGAGLVGRIYAGGDGEEQGARRPGEPGKNFPFGEVTLKNCVNNLDVEATKEKDDKTGGLTSYIQFYTKLTIENCENNGDIYGTSYTGGIMGYSSGVAKSSYYTNPVSTDKIPANDPRRTPLSTEEENQFTSVTLIKNTHNKGKISAGFGAIVKANYCVGGLIGYRVVADIATESTFDVLNCSNSGEIIFNYEYNAEATDVNKVTPNFNLGGLAGYFQVRGAQVTIENCNNTGNITLTSTAPEGKDNLKLGYLFGFLKLDEANAKGGQIEIKTCSNSGKIYHSANKTTTTDGKDTTQCCGAISVKVQEDLNKLVFNEETFFTNTGVVEALPTSNEE